MQLEIHQILNTLPHRYPFLLVDKVLHVEPEKSITAIKNVTMNEPFFTGHFPENPVMPGVMIIEALAQAGGVLAYMSSKHHSKEALYYLAGVDKTRFKRVVLPGDQLTLTVEVLRGKQGIWKYYGEARVDGELACSAELLSAVKEKQ